MGKLFAPKAPSYFSTFPRLVEDSSTNCSKDVWKECFCFIHILYLYMYSFMASNFSWFLKSLLAKRFGFVWDWCNDPMMKPNPVSKLQVRIVQDCLARGSIRVQHLTAVIYQWKLDNTSKGFIAIVLAPDWWRWVAGHFLWKRQLQLQEKIIEKRENLTYVFTFRCTFEFTVRNVLPMCAGGRVYWLGR